MTIPEPFVAGAIAAGLTLIVLGVLVLWAYRETER